MDLTQRSCFAGQVPSFFLAPLAGVLVDRWNRHRTLVVTQVLSLVQSALLAVVAFRGETGTAAILEIVALSLFQGVINAFDVPARRSSKIIGVSPMRQPATWQR